MSKLARENILNLAVYKPGKPIEEVQRELGLKEVIKLASNENPLGPSPRVRDYLCNNLEEINYYPDAYNHGLRSRLADFYQISFEELHFGNGSNEIVQQLSLAFLEPGDQALMPVPTFPRYAPLAQMMNAEALEVPLLDFHLDLEAMADKISPTTKLIYICSPNNPTGGAINKNDFKQFLAQVPPGCLVILDEAYFEYLDGSNNHLDGLDFVKSNSNVVVLRTFSKMYGLAGLRVGYAVADPEIIACLDRVREPFNVNRLAQTAAMVALEDQQHIEKVKNVNRTGKEYLYRELQRLGLTYVPTDANFILFDAGHPEEKVFQGLLQRGIIIRGGFGYPTHLRVTIGTEYQNKRFIQALEDFLNKGE